MLRKLRRLLFGDCKHVWSRWGDMTIREDAKAYQARFCHKCGMGELRWL